MLHDDQVNMQHQKAARSSAMNKAEALQILASFVFYALFLFYLDVFLTWLDWCC